MLSVIGQIIDLYVTIQNSENQESVLWSVGHMARFDFDKVTVSLTVSEVFCLRSWLKLGLWETD